MAKGASQRRRLKNFNNAREAKRGLHPLPPPPEEVSRHKRFKRSEGSGSASFRKLLQLKAASASQENPEARTGKRKRGEDVEKAGYSKSLKSETATHSLAAAEPDASKEGLRLPQRKRKLGQPEQSFEIFPSKPTKARKKEFLKARKLKKKAAKRSKAPGLQFQNAEKMTNSGHDRKALSQPVFGEQALQPPKIASERKQWSSLQLNGPRQAKRSKVSPTNGRNR